MRSEISPGLRAVPPLGSRDKAVGGEGAKPSQADDNFAFWDNILEVNLTSSCCHIHTTHLVYIH